jgi:hypothetical protein
MVVLQSLGDTQAVDVMTLVWVKLIVVLVTKCDDAEDRGCANVFAVIDTDVMLVSNLFVTSSHDQPATTSYTPNSIASQNHNAFILRRDGNAEASVVEDVVWRELYVSVQLTCEAQSDDSPSGCANNYVSPPR